MLYRSGMHNAYCTEVKPSGMQVVPAGNVVQPKAGNWRTNQRANPKVIKGVGSAVPSHGKGLPRSRNDILSPKRKRAVNARAKRLAAEIKAAPQGNANSYRAPNVHSACARPLPGSVF